MPVTCWAGCLVAAAWRDIPAWQWFRLVMVGGGESAIPTGGKHMVWSKAQDHYVGSLFALRNKLLFHVGPAQGGYKSF